MKRPWLILMFLLPGLLSALSVEKGNLKIVADDETGGYLCYSRLSEDSAWMPLFVESFTSSYIQMKVDGEEVLPGNSREYTLRFEQTDDSLAVIFEGNAIGLTETIGIREDLRGTAYFSLSLEIENTGDDTVEAGMKKVFDTAFVRGETHFLVQGESIGEEIAFEKGSIPSSLLSLGENPGEKLYFRIAPDGTSSPDRLLLVNWNRLDRKSWDYKPAEGTNFNALPFSINDSALGLFWEPALLKTGETVKAYLALGPYDMTLKEDTGSAAEETPVLPMITADPALALLHLEEQLEYIDLFLADLNRLIEESGALSNDQLLSLEDRLEILEQKKRDYEKLR